MTKKGQSFINTLYVCFQETREQQGSNIQESLKRLMDWIDSTLKYTVICVGGWWSVIFDAMTKSDTVT